MPRRIALQVPQAISRLLKGGYLKTAPASYQALLAYPPTLPPTRAPYPRPEDDLPDVLLRKARRAHGDPSRRRDPINAKKMLRARAPSTKPKPIVYLHDRVRKQFYQDHPWEGLRPRIMVEKGDIAVPTEIPVEVTELTWWSTVPQPEDVIALTVHMHKHHSMSLANSYQYVLAQFHSLRAEHENASRYALLEAQAYGARFNPPHQYLQEQYGNRVWHAAPEMYREIKKQDFALKTWVKTTPGTASQGPQTIQAKKVKRLKPVATGDWTGGEEYRRGAKAILEGTAGALAYVRATQEVEAVPPTEEPMVGSIYNDPLSAYLKDELTTRASEVGLARR